jgi:predicted nucleic acid-binding protein
MILLDTNIVIAFFNGNNLVKRKIQERIERVALTPIFAELLTVI